MLYQAENPHGGDIYGETIRLDYSANTNPFGTPPAVLEAMSQALSQVHYYPDPYCRELVQAIGEFEQVPKEMILCGNGAAELIYAYCQAVWPKRAVELAPTFAEYSLGLEQAGCQVKRYGLRQEMQFELQEDFLIYLEEQKPEAVFLCNPNNPTGKLIAPAFLERILVYCSQQGIRLFLDECFLDLSDDGVSMKSYLKAYPNLFILKAFTKSYGMAGVRLGYCLCADKNLLADMSRIVQPWNVSVLAQAAGAAALKEQEFLKRTRTVVQVERQWLKEQLEALGFTVCPSRVNYLLFQGPVDLHKALRKQGIAIRSCDNYHGLTDGWYRIAVRLHEENEQLIEAMKQVCEKKWVCGQEPMCGKEQLWQKTL